MKLHTNGPYVGEENFRSKKKEKKKFDWKDEIELMVSSRVK